MESRGSLLAYARTLVAQFARGESLPNRTAKRADGARAVDGNGRFLLSNSFAGVRRHPPNVPCRQFVIGSEARNLRDQ